jgi:hypothetical protein
LENVFSGDIWSMIKRAAIILSRDLVIRTRAATQGFRRRHEERRDVEGLDVQRLDKERRDVQGIHVEGQHEKGRYEEELTQCFHDAND